MQSGADTVLPESPPGELEFLHDRCLDLSFQAVSLSRQLDVSKAQLQVFQNFSLLSSHETDLDDLLKRILTLVLNVLGAEAGAVYLVVDRSKGECRFAAVQGNGVETLRQTTLQNWGGIAGWVMKSGKPYLSADPQHDPSGIPKLTR